MVGEYTKKFNAKQLADLKKLGLPFVSEGKSLFYAGEGNWGRAVSFAERNQMNPIQGTRGGSVLNKLDTNQNLGRTFGNLERFKIWDSASRSYAAQATKKITTRVAGADNFSTFRRIELPTLLNNKKVEAINGVDRQKLRDFKHNTYNRLRAQGADRRQAARQAQDASHRKVAVAELKQDIAQARKEGGRKLEADVKARANALKTQHNREQNVKKASQIEKREQERAKKWEERKGEIKTVKQNIYKARAGNDRKAVSEGKKKFAEIRKDHKRDIRAGIQDRGMKQAVAEKLKISAVTQSSVKKTRQPSQGAANDKAKAVSQAKSQNSVQAHGLPKEKAQKIHDRALDRAKKAGLSDTAARSRAETRVAHVAEKAGLLKERAAIKADPKQKTAVEYFKKDANFREKRISDLKTQAVKENKPYKGPTSKPPGLREVETKANAQALVSRARLDNRHNAGEITIRDYASMKSTLENNLSQYRSESLSSYFQSANQSSPGGTAQSNSMNGHAGAATKSASQSFSHSR